MALVGQILLSSAAFLGFSLILFLPVEYLVPARDVKSRPPLADWLHFWINPAIAALFALTVLAFIGGIARSLLPAPMVSWIAGLSLWQQLILAVVMAEMWSYWAHRLSHSIPFLWNFHRVHHSIEEMSWVSAHREHPIDAVWILAGANLPAFALGIDLRALAFFVFIERSYTVLLHANIDFTYGWLDGVLASPRFHHWHHDAGDKGRNRNYAGVFSCLDWIFGTWQSPATAPEVFGPKDLAPAGYWKQIVLPGPKAPPSASSPSSVPVTKNPVKAIG